MYQTRLASVPQWEYNVMFFPWEAAPDWNALGQEGWEFVYAYETAKDPEPTGQPFAGRTYVFKRPIITAKS